MIENSEQALAYLEAVVAGEIAPENPECREAALIVTRGLRQATQALADHAAAVPAGPVDDKALRQMAEEWLAHQANGAPWEADVVALTAQMRRVADAARREEREKLKCPECGARLWTGSSSRGCTKCDPAVAVEEDPPGGKPVDCDEAAQAFAAVLSALEAAEAPDDLGVIRDARALSARCGELRDRLVRHGQRAEAAEAREQTRVKELEELLAISHRDREQLLRMRDADTARLREAEAENEALIQTSGDLCEVCGWRGKRGGACAFCEVEALRAEALRHAGECARYAANDRAVIADLMVEVQQALREGSIADLLPLRENPYDSLTIHYDAGEWSVVMHEDAGRHVDTGPQPSLLDAVLRALASGEESRHD